MRVLLVDNYDSFTWNLAHQLYRVSGCMPTVIASDDPGFRPGDLDDFDAAIISPGPGRPERPADLGHSAAVLRDGRLPVLGVCLGHQAIGHLLGAPVRHAPEPMHGRLSPIHHDGRGLFADIPSPAEVVRYHSLVLGALPPELERSAWTAEGLIMGLRHRSRPLWGLQFHPESICTRCGDTLLANFCRLVRARRPPRPIRRPPPSPPRGALRVFTRRLPAALDAPDIYRACFADSPSSFWLDGGADPARPGVSFMGDCSGPRSRILRYDAHRRRVHISGPGGELVREASIFDVLREDLAAHSAANPSPYSFGLGWVGYLGYECKADCGGEATHRSDTPDAALIFADRAIAFDHRSGALTLMLLGRDLSELDDWAEALRRRLDRPPPQPPAPTAAPHFRYAHSPRAYLARIADCQHLIREGESYEICLTNQASAEARLDPLGSYLALRRVNPAPFAALLRFPDFSVLSASPERFLKIGPDGLAESKPIKGTSPRSADEREDRLLAEALRSSEKERAENLMIVDLVRSDLGRVCTPDSVSVPGLFQIESFATVHQLVSTVRGVLSPGTSPVDCVRACFPAGSMTGAPKVRTMQIIDRLEGRARGVYSGALGYLSLDGAVDLSVVIRSLVLHPNRVTFGTGGAIVALSDPRAELEETTLKAAALIAALGISRYD